MDRLIDYGDECPICGKTEEDCACDPALILKLKKETSTSGKIRKRRKEEN